MSHWKDAKIELKCTVEVFKRALLKVCKEWEQYIQVSEEGKQDMYYYDKRKGDMGTVHIMIPGMGRPDMGKAPGVQYNDLGFRRLADGSWELLVDNFEQSEYFKEKITAEVSRMKILAVARMKQAQVLANQDLADGSSRVVVRRKVALEN